MSFDGCFFLNQKSLRLFVCDLLVQSKRDGTDDHHRRRRCRQQGEPVFCSPAPLIDDDHD